ncbi:Sec-independent protein translocase protein TatB [Actibacterium sp. 188UL27-1]|uniref:Sec-independent protein translocase protein TatB n=1 Tax=Actibacterium sp. 188UL27-1 TaxID=2786961 RepID=UPI00351C7332
MRPKKTKPDPTVGHPAGGYVIGWTEIMVIGIVALIVVGPKDLPGLFREVGRFTGKVRGMAREFSRAMDEAADQSGVNDMAKTLRTASNPKAYGIDALKKATSLDGDDEKPAPAKPMGTETQKLAEDRAEAARKLRQETAERAAARKAETTAPAVDPAPAAPAPEQENKV